MAPRPSRRSIRQPARTDPSSTSTISGGPPPVPQGKSHPMLVQREVRVLIFHRARPPPAAVPGRWASLIGYARASTIDQQPRVDEALETTGVPAGDG